ncbi:MAG: M28 family metallopeptidase [Vicinamibacteraceae bacterium]
MQSKWRSALTLAMVCVALPALGSGRAIGASDEEKGGFARVRAHMEFLADDLLEGREAGTRGYDVTAKYVAAVLQTYGYAPAGASGTFFQPVPLLESRLTKGELTFAPKRGVPVAFDLPAEAVVAPNHLRASFDVTAPLVYVGFGVTAPELKYDDYAAVDARGKIVLLLRNAPTQFPSEPRAHYASLDHKLQNAADHGAVGVLIAALPSDLKRFSWERIAQIATEPLMTWIDAPGQPANQHPELQGGALLGPGGATKLFAHSPTPLDEVYAAGEAGKPESFELPVTVTIKGTTAHQKKSSPNVVGVLTGRDPALAKSYVVLTAHLDHTGIGPAVRGDTIYNGAYDNAAGSGILLEVARAIAEAPERPRRSVLVTFVTAEEKGLLGSDYFARNPTVPADALVANVNLDMPVLQWPLADVVAFGAENSSLGTVVARAVKRAGLTLSPDPLPDENLFVRSDQYSLVKQGVPAVYLMPGFTSSDPQKDGGKILGSFLASHYHQPSDELSLPMDGSALETFTQANYLIAVAIANDAEAPTWKPGNFFGERFGRR